MGIHTAIADIFSINGKEREINLGVKQNFLHTGHWCGNDSHKVNREINYWEFESQSNSKLLSF